MAGRQNVHSSLSLFLLDNIVCVVGTSPSVSREQQQFDDVCVSTRTASAIGEGDHCCCCWLPIGRGCGQL